jgi:hypothetical protein
MLKSTRSVIVKPAWPAANEIALKRADDDPDRGPAECAPDRPSCAERVRA